MIYKLYHLNCIININEMYFENRFQRENGIYLPNPYGMQVS